MYLSIRLFELVLGEDGIRIEVYRSLVSTTAEVACSTIDTVTF